MAARVLALLLLSILNMWGLPNVARAESTDLVYPPPEAVGDERHLYYWQLLDAALAANRDKYGDYTTRAYGSPMTFQRGVAEVESGNGRVNIVSRATNLDLEKRLLPIRISLDKGLLGFRMFLIMPETQARLDQVRTAEELKQQFTIGQSASWTDVQVLQAAGFKLVLADGYQPLFSMLGSRRFDLFARGIIEIEAELRANRESVPEMVIDKRILLHYPMPRYFFVARTAEGKRLAERIEDGLLRLRRSGEFERRYQNWKKLVLRNLQISDRLLIKLPNPELSPEAPLDDKYWWDSLSHELAPR